MNKSTKANEMLINKAGKKLIADCPSRWSSTFLMLRRLLLVKTELSSVLEVLQWDNLPNSHWKQIDNMVELLKPFAHYTQLTSSEDTTSISMVVPVIMELRLHLEQMSSVHRLGQIVATMLGELERRFGYIINPTMGNFDPLYIICTFLSPAYIEILNDEQVAAAKTHLVKQLNPLVNRSHDEEPTQAEATPRTSDPTAEPPPKKFKHLQELLKEKQKAKSNASCSTLSEEKAEVEKYAQSDYTGSIDEDEDCFSFWREKKEMYPLLSSLAFDLLSTASTAPVEQIFSIGGDATTGKQNRLTDFNLEKEIFLTKNKRYMHLLPHT